MEATMRRKSESGQALVFAALALVVLIGFAGLAIDMGVLRYQKRLQQSAADAAAIAGASNLASTSGGVTTGAQNASATNGFTDNGGGQTSACTASGATVGTVCVQVNNPPLSGPHASGANAGKYVEVLVAVVQPTYFMKIFGTSSEVITARAVATNLSGGTGGGCMYTLGPPSSAIEGVNINGSAVLNATTCGIVDNGDFNTKGNKLIVNAATFGVAGGANQSGPGGTVTCADQAPTDCPTYGTPASGDPLSSLTAPAVGTPQAFNAANITPGTYSSISLSGNGTYTFPAGTYVLDGGNFSCTGTPSIRGTGVTFYFTNGATYNCTGNVSVQLTAPSTGTYAGVLFYQDPNDTSGPSIGGDNTTYFDGALYFPKSQVTFFGNSVSYNVAIVIADAIALSGNPTVNLQGAAGLPAGVNLISNAVLVE
jgi:Flp pilus assembly protein TadG